MQKSHTNDLYKDFNVLKIENINKFNMIMLFETQNNP